MSCNGKTRSITIPFEEITQSRRECESQSIHVKNLKLTIQFKDTKSLRLSLSAPLREKTNGRY